MEIFHSVILDEEECVGCTNCIQRCPTEAIRVRGGKASIIDLRCVDCGECIRACQHKAKKALTDEISELDKYDYKIAIPAPTLFGQFPPDISPYEVIGGLISIGFDDVYEAAKGADFCTVAIKEFLKRNPTPRPFINSACPAVVRLIQVLYPDLLSLILPLEAPVEIAAQKAKEKVLLKDPGLKVGTFFLTPCPAKVTAHRAPEGNPFSNVDHNIAISSIYGPILAAIKKGVKPGIVRASGSGLGWARAGGENQALGLKRHLSVDGIHEVLVILEELEKGNLPPVDFIELLACSGGCVGGPLTVTNKFISRNRIRTLAEAEGSKKQEDVNPEQIAKEIDQGKFTLSQDLKPRPLIRFDRDIKVAISKMEEGQRVEESLPGLDCGACGAPTCHALAEDIVNQLANTSDCIFRVREEIKELAQKLFLLSERSFPAENQTKKDPEK